MIHEIEFKPRVILETEADKVIIYRIKHRSDAYKP